MAAEIQLNVLLNDSNAQKGLNKLIDSAKLLESKKIKLDIDGSTVNQTLQNIQRFASVTLSSLKGSWNDFKAAVEAPLNLTGVRQLTSMLESMEGSLLLNQIQSNIVSGFSNSVERFDILKTFPKVMEQIGFTTDESAGAMDRLYQSVLGLPTAFEDITDSAQYFALIFGDLNKATDLAIAANNAFVASGATSNQISTGMRQLQYIIEGTQLRSTQWYSLIRSMPLALREVGKALGYSDFGVFTNELIQNKVNGEDLINTLIDVGLHSESLAGVVEVMKTRIRASLDNVTNAAKRMGNSFLEALDETLLETGGKNVADNIKGVSKVIDHIAEVGAQWIRDNGDKIQALIDKFMNIDWASVIPNFFQGLVDIANTALDNIGTWITDIGNIISMSSTLFNTIENSRVLKVLESFVNGFGNILSIGAASKILFGGMSLFGSGVSGVASGVSGFASGVALPVFLTLLGGAGGAIVTSPFIQATAEGIEYIANDINKTKNKSAISEYEQKNMEAALQYIRSHPEFSYSDIVSLVNEYNDLHSSRNAAGMVMRGSGDEQKANQKRHEYLRNFLLGIGIYATPRTGFKDIGIINIPENIDDYLKELELQEKQEQLIEAEAKKLEELSKQEPLVSEIINRIISRTDLISQLRTYYDGVIGVIDEKITELENKRQELLDRIASSPQILNREYFKNQGGLFSESYEQAEGKGYSEVTKDIADFYENNFGSFEDWISGMSEYINSMEDGESKEIAKQYYADLLKNFDIGDPDQIALILKNYGIKTPEEVVTDYFLEQARAAISRKNWQDAIDSALAEEYGIELEEYQAQKESLENEETSAIGFVLKGIEEDYEKIQEEYPEVFTYVMKSNSELKNSFEEALTSLDSTPVVGRINSYYSDLVEAVYNGNARLRKAMSLGYFTSSKYLGGDETLYSATGGFVPRGTDTIPAMLTPGEYIQRRAAVQKFGKTFMDRINNLDLTGALRSLSIAIPFATGGLVKNDSRSYRDNHATVNQVFNTSSANYGFRRANRYVRALS